MMKVVNIKVTKEEYDILASIYETDGAEVIGDGTYDSLVEKGLVVIGGGRGPGRLWRRVTLTDIGKIVGSGFQVNVTIEE